MARVEIPAPGDLIMDSAGNVRVAVAVSLKLAGTSTDVTHYSALTAGTSTTGGLVSGSDGTIVDGSGNRRYVDSGQTLDLLILGRTRQIEAGSGGSQTAISPKAHGGDPTGVADASAAITAALATGHPVDLGGPENTWKITTGITLPTGASIIASGATLDFSSVTGTFVAMTATGNLSALNNLTADATAQDGTLTVSNAGVSNGDWIKLSSLALTGTVSLPKGEFVHVRTASTMTTSDKIADSYALADTAKIEKANFVTGITVRGLRFRGPTNNALTITGLQLDTVYDAVVASCVFDRCHYRAIGMQDAVEVSITDCHVRDSLLASTAYGIAVHNACQDISIKGCTGKRMRHLVTHGGAITRSGVPRRTITDSCVAIQMVDAGFDCHPGAEDVSFTNNTVISGDQQGLASSQDGIIHQGVSGVISGNTVRGPTGHGVRVQTLSYRAGSFTVTGNKVSNTGDRGIYVQTVNTASVVVPRAVTITGNTVDTPATTGIEINAALSVLSYATITGNVVRNPTTQGILADTVTGGVISGNTIEVPSANRQGIYCLAFTDGTVTGNVVRMGSATGSIGIRLDQNASAVGSSGTVVADNRVTGAATGITFLSTTTNSTASGNRLHGNTVSASLSTGAGNRAYGNTPGVVATVASASTVTLPASEGDVFKISGVAAIDTITATDMAGRTVRLITTSTAAFNDGTGNLKLVATRTGTADDQLIATCDGTNWFEAAWAVN